MDKELEWDKVISPNTHQKYVNFKEIWDYREMSFVLIKKGFIAQYKQTILGPLWAFIKPIMSCFTFTFVFGNIAKLSTDGVPQVLYYFTMLLFWNYFSSCLSSTSNTFLSNAYLMSKVYFPRFIMPITSAIYNLISFGIQVILFILLYIFFKSSGYVLELKLTTLLIPLFMLQLVLLALGIGSMISSVTIKYRDLGTIIGFFISLWFYVCPIAYSSAIIPKKYYFIYHLNPVTNILEWISYSLFGVGHPSISFLIYSFIISIIIFFIGMRFFQKTERTFIDII